MKYIYFFLIFFIEIFSAFSQKEFRFSIVDKETNEPLQFATLLFFYDGKCNGAYSDSKGIIMIGFPDNVDSFKVSCIGYKPTTIVHYQMDDTIKLKGESYILKEIPIKPYNKNDLKTIGFSTKKTKQNIGAFSGAECAVLISNEDKKEHFIKSILYNIKIQESFPFVFRAHLYLSDSLGMPGKEAINRNLTVVLSKNEDGLVEVDISSLLIKIPVGGIFVGIEWIGRLEPKANQIIYFDGIQKAKYVSLGASIKFFDSYDKHLTYMRSIKENKNWDNRMLINLNHFENSIINAAFGLRLFDN